MPKPLHIPAGAMVRKVNLAALSPAAKAIAAESELEVRLFRHCELFAKSKGLPLPEKQVAFEAKANSRRFDLGFAEYKLGVECQGGTWARGRSGHSTGKGIARDNKKGNAATVRGWRVLRYDAVDLDEKRIGAAVEEIYAVIALLEIERAAQ